MPAHEKQSAPALTPVAVVVAGAALRPSAAFEGVKADLRTVNRQFDSLIGEVRRLQGIVHDLEALGAF